MKNLQISAGIDNDKIILKFSESVFWVSFTPEEAIKFCDTIKEKAQNILIKRG